MKLAIIYFSKGGRTRQMAEAVAEGARRVPDTEAALFDLDHIDYDYVAQAGAVVFGTPTYYANLCWQMKKWFDEAYRCDLSGKLGAAFATADYPQGGADVAVLTLLQHMLVKGMLVYSGGAVLGKPFLHLGAVANKENFEHSRPLFQVFGERIARQAEKLGG